MEMQKANFFHPAQMPVSCAAKTHQATKKSLENRQKTEAERNYCILTSASCECGARRGIYGMNAKPRRDKPDKTATGGGTWQLQQQRLQNPATQAQVPYPYPTSTKNNNNGLGGEEGDAVKANNTQKLW